MRVAKPSTPCPTGLLLLLVASFFACRGETSPTSKEARTFDEELTLAVRAGRDQLTDDERQALRAENHPLLAQIGDPNTVQLIRMFAQLPDGSHARLKADGHLKWDVAALDEPRRQLLREMIQLNIDLAARQGGQVQPGFSIEALGRSQTGFAIVDIAETGQRVVSWFVLWPELPDPTWVTVVNARAAGSQPYFRAHLERLPQLRALATTEVPEAVAAGGARSVTGAD